MKSTTTQPGRNVKMKYKTAQQWGAYERVFVRIIAVGINAFFMSLHKTVGMEHGSGVQITTFGVHKLIGNKQKNLRCQVIDAANFNINLTIS